MAYFEPLDGANGTLGLALKNSSATGAYLDPIYDNFDSQSPVYGISGLLHLNSSAILSVPILGSIRTIRDFVEGPSLLQPTIQDAIKYGQDQETVSISRLWLDNVTTTTLAFSPADGGSIKINNRTLNFEAGTYAFNASFNFPQLRPLSQKEVLNSQSQGLVTQGGDGTESLSFLSYSDKLLAGAWRFLTYFGRDSMISLLLMEPILSPGEGGAIEAVIGAVLERLNSTDGSVCHEETIGDYATYLNLKDNITSTAPQYDYKMIDSDFYLPIVLAHYLLDNPVGQQRASQFLNTTSTVNPKNSGMTYKQLALLTAEKIVAEAAPFAGKANQTVGNLIHLKDDQVVGEWRDSTFGIGGGRIPYDVNSALVPAALRAIAALAKGGFFPEHPDWNSTVAEYAQVWEDNALQFFEVSVPASDARTLVDSYTKENDLPFPSHSDNITSPTTFYAVALDGNDNQTVVKIMNTDDCFRLFLLNATNQIQLSAFLAQTADHILQPFPVGLSTDIGLLVANPAYGGDAVYSANWTNSAYHGTVVWSWPLAMMAAGLERQLGRCADSSDTPAFCADAPLHGRVVAAYNHLWDLIESNAATLSSEVWSWTYSGGKFVSTPLGSLPPPPGTSPTESDIRQLWSLTFLAVTRNEDFK